MKFFSILLILICAFSNLTFADDNDLVTTDEKHPIEKKLAVCLAKEENMTTAGMTNCTIEASKEWDRELNVVYKKLMSVLTKDEKKHLRDSQRQWIKYRDIEYKFIGIMYDNFVGTMYVPMRAMEFLSIVKQRTLELQGYLFLKEL